MTQSVSQGEGARAEDGVAPFQKRVAAILEGLPRQEGRIALITGASGDLGVAMATQLAHRGSRLVFAVRDTAKGEAARSRVLSHFPDANITLMRLDLGSLESVREFSRAYLERFERLDSLFLNAGVMAIERRTTEDGFEAQLGVNHLGHFALAAQLSPLFTAAGGTRVVATTSSAAYVGRIDFDDPMGKQKYDRWQAYCQSKLANVMFVNALQRRFELAGAESRAHSAHPGLVSTNLQRSAARSSGSRAEAWALTGLVPLLGQSPQSGALAMIRAGLSPRATGGDLWGPRWFHTRGEPILRSQPRASRDADAQERLWQLSEELTGVEFRLDR